MTKGVKVVAAIGAGAGIVGLGYLLWRKFRKRGTPTAEQWNIFASMGDANRDGYIDAIDLGLVGEAFGSVGGGAGVPASPNWNPACDFNKDSRVDVFDEVILGLHYGKNIWDYFGL